MTDEQRDEFANQIFIGPRARRYCGQAGGHGGRVPYPLWHCRIELIRVSWSGPGGCRLVSLSYGEVSMIANIRRKLYAV